MYNMLYASTLVSLRCAIDGIFSEWGAMIFYLIAYVATFAPGVEISSAHKLFFVLKACSLQSKNAFRQNVGKQFVLVTF